MTLHVQHHVSADGHELWLYAATPLPAPHPAAIAAAPVAAGAAGHHLRWHPLRGEWIIYPGEPIDDGAAAIETAAEVPGGAWRVVVREEHAAALRAGIEPPAIALPDDVTLAPSGGRCEVVVFSQDPGASLAALPVEHLDLILAVWAERTAALGARDDVAYVFASATADGGGRGLPHGRIDAYPFVPPAVERALTAQRAYHARHQRGPLTQLVADELAAGTRMIHTGDHAVAFVPACARRRHEVWIAPRRAAPSLSELDGLERRSLAAALALALRKLDGVSGGPAAYVLGVHQAPPRGEQAGAHLHLELLPCGGRGAAACAAAELMTGAVVADGLPEVGAAELRAVEVAP